MFALDEKVFGAGSDANLGFHGSDIQADSEVSTVPTYKLTPM